MDKSKSQTQNQQNVAQPTSAVQQHPVSPVGTPNKESAPIAQTAEAPVADFLKVADSEPQIHPEAREAGVEAVAENPTIPEEVKQAGVTLAKESVVVNTEPTGAVTLPMSMQQATQTIKVNKNDKKKSIVWFATIILRLLKKQNAKPVKGEDIIGG